MLSASGLEDFNKAKWEMSREFSYSSSPSSIRGTYKIISNNALIKGLGEIRLCCFIKHPLVNCDTIWPEALFLKAFHNTCNWYKGNRFYK